MLQDGDHYFMDINCDRCLVSFSVTIELTESAFEHYASSGRAYISNLATQMLYRSDPCDARDLRHPVMRAQIHRSVIAWRGNH